MSNVTTEYWDYVGQYRKSMKESDRVRTLGMYACQLLDELQGVDLSAGGPELSLLAVKLLNCLKDAIECELQVAVVVDGFACSDTALCSEDEVVEVVHECSPVVDAGVSVTAGGSTIGDNPAGGGVARGSSEPTTTGPVPCYCDWCRSFGRKP